MRVRQHTWNQTRYSDKDQPILGQAMWAGSSRLCQISACNVCLLAIPALGCRLSFDQFKEAEYSTGWRHFPVC